MGNDFPLSASDLLGFVWSYDTVNTSGVAGPKISKVYKDVLEKEVTVSVRADKWNDFMKITEQDIIAETPGKLYVGDQYLSCYVTSGSPEFYANGFVVMTLTIAASYPYWCSEQKFTFSEGMGSSDADYPYDYPYDYLSVLESGILINAHYAPTPFRMYLYGPCVNPSLYISEHLYRVNATLEEGEYIVVDSRDRTVIKVNSAGVQSNMFDAREKSSDIFAPIPGGENSMFWDGNFWFDITLIAERSSPIWTL